MASDGDKLINCEVVTERVFQWEAFYLLHKPITENGQCDKIGAAYSGSVVRRTRRYRSNISG